MKYKVHPIDDYNGMKIHWGGATSGTLTSQFGNPAPRHGWKLLLEYEI